MLFRFQGPVLFIYFKSVYKLLFASNTPRIKKSTKMNLNVRFYFFFFERHVITLIVEGLKRNISNNFAGCNFHHFFFLKNIIIIVKIYFMIFSKNIYIFLIKFPSTLQKKNFPFLRISLPWQLLAALSIGSQISSFPFCIWTTH